MFPPRAPVPPFLARLDDYVGLFRAEFRRREQASWAAVYLQGLLLDVGRKNIETLARRVVLPPDLAVEDPVQALQNFINQSPWDDRKLLRRYRALMAARRPVGRGTFVVSDLTFPKQGDRSVGVQRQLSREYGRKINCQVAVTLAFVGADVAYPLAARLYLPRGWLRAPGRLVSAGVPEAHRGAAGKARIALDLLDEARADGPTTATVAAGPGYDDSEEFRDGLAGRGLEVLDEPAPRQLLVRQGGDIWQSLKADLGLDHFEGRSWRGFHHHATLVMLAHGFRLLERAGALVEEMAATPRE